MKKVKVIKQFGDIEVNSELTYNDKYDSYEFTVTAEEVSKDARVSSSRYLSLSKEVVESNIGNYFEYLNVTDWSKASYVKPIIIKAVIEGNTANLKGWDGSTVAIDKDTFSKLFKVIE